MLAYLILIFEISIIICNCYVAHLIKKNYDEIRNINLQNVDKLQYEVKETKKTKDKVLNMIKKHNFDRQVALHNRVNNKRE